MFKSDIEYDEGLDILEIHRIDSGAAADHSINDRDIAIFSFNEKEEIVGMEFFNASKLFNISKSYLTNIKDCKVKIDYDRKNKILHFFITLQGETKEEENISFPVADIELKNMKSPITVSCSC